MSGVVQRAKRAVVVLLALSWAGVSASPGLARERSVAAPHPDPVIAAATAPKGAPSTYSGADVPAARDQDLQAAAMPQAHDEALPGDTVAALLTLADAVQRALAAAPQVAAARAAEAAARAQLADAAADLAPALSLSGSAFHYQKPALVTPIHGFTPGLFPSFDRTVMLGDLQLRYDLWDGGVRAARVAQRREQLAAAQAAASAVAAAAGARTIAAYLAVRTLDEQLAAHGERLAALAAERRRVEQLLDVGRAAQVDLLRIQAAQAAAEADRVGLVANRDRHGRELLRLLGDDPMVAALPPLAAVALAEPQPPPRRDLLARALAKSGDLGRARRELAAAESAVTAARAGRAPALRAEGNYLGFAGGNGDAAAEWNVGLRVAVPLWDRHVAVRVALAAAGRDAAAAALRIAEDEVAAALDRAWAELESARAREGSLGEAEARYAEVLRIETLRLSAGAGVEADYLRAEADLLAARASAVEARNRVAASRAELARVTGELSADWVARSFTAAPAAPAPRAPGGGGR